MITIRSINGEVLTHFDNDVPNGNPYFEPVMTDDMESLISSFSFSVPLQLADTEYLVGLNQVLTYDRQGDLRLFVISDVYEDWSTTGGVVKVDCEDISITEMNNIVVNPFNGIDFNDSLYKTFNGSGWTVKYGANWQDVIHTTFVLEDYTNMRDVLSQLKDTYDCQFKFMAQENEYGEITRVVEVFKSLGNDNGKYFYYDRDLLGIERDISFTDVKTAIHPYYVGYNGKTYTLANWAPVSPDPDFRKDKASPLIINKEAHTTYDDSDSYRIMPYKTEVQGDPELVYREAIKELKKHAEPVYTYTVNAILLQNLIEWEGEDIDLGDTVWMKERVGNRELGLEARVVAYEYHEDDPSADKVTFSNFKEIDTKDTEDLSNRIFIAYANSADGHVDFSIDDSVNKSYMGVYTSTAREQSTDPDTYNWTKIKGEDGNSAPTLNLTSSQQVMKFKSDGTPDGDQDILFTALKQNSTDPIVWEAIPYKGDTAQPAITLEGTGDSRTLKSSQWDKDWARVQVTITMGALKDIQTIVLVSDGATGASGTAIVGYVTNESTTFASDADGTVVDYSQGSGKFVIYEGTKEVTSGVLYAKQSNVGINLVINASTGEYTVANMTQDQAQAVVKATYKGVTITKFLSFAKSRQGQQGAPSNLHTAWAHVGEFPEFVKDAEPNEYRLSDRVTMVSNNASLFPVITTFMSDQDGTWFTRVTRDRIDLTPATLSLYNAIDVREGTLEQSLVGKRVMLSARYRASKPLDRVVLMSAYVTSSGTTNLPLNGKEVALTTEFVEFHDVIENWEDGIHTLRFCPKQPMGLDSVEGLYLDLTGFKITILDKDEEPKPTPWIPPLSRPLKTPKNIFVGGNTRDFVSSAGSTITNTHNIKVDEWGVTDAVTTVATGGTTINKAVLPVKSDGSYLADGSTGYVMRMYVRNNSATDAISLLANGTPYNQNMVKIPPKGSGLIYLPYFEPAKDSAIVFQMKSLDPAVGVDFTWSTPEIYEYNIVHGFTTKQASSDGLEYLGIYSDDKTVGLQNPAQYSWSLVKGADGEAGKDGTPAKLLSLQADSYVMKFDSTGKIISGQTISFTAIIQNITGTSSWLATPYIGTAAQPPITLAGSGNVRTLAGSQWGDSVTKIIVKVTVGDFTDTVIINKLQDGAKGDKGEDGANGTDGTDGSPALSAFLSTETVSLPATFNGDVTSYANAKGTMMVYEGLTRVTSGVTFSLGAHANTTATVNASTGAYAVTELTADSATVVINAVYKGTTLAKTFSLSKAKQGSQGVQGTMGIAFYSPTEPTGSTVTDGATWFKTASENDDTVVGIYTRKNGAWVETPLASGTLAVQELSAISANIGDITAGNLTGIEITGSKFNNPFDFIAADGNHLQGITAISDAELDISGTVNAGSEGERKFHTSVEPLYFQAVYSDAADNILRSINVSNSGYTLVDTTTKVTTAFSSGQFQSVDNLQGKSVIAGLDVVGVQTSENAALMTPKGFFLNNRKNVDIWTGTGAQTNNTPNNARLRFAGTVSYGWGTLPEDDPFEQVAPYLWRVKRETKFAWRINVNIQDATSDYVYFKMYFKDAEDTDVNPQAQIQSGRITSDNNSGSGVNLRMQNTVFLQGYHKAPAGTYFSLVTECRGGRHCGNVKVENAEFIEIYEY